MYIYIYIYIYAYKYPDITTITYLSFVHTICSSDIDECAEGTSHCEQICTNTNGSFVCSCFDGFLLNMVDNKTCNISKSPDIGMHI